MNGGATRARRWVPLTLKVLVSATAAGTLVAAAPVAASASTCQQWSTGVPNVGTGDMFSGAAVTSACNAWAVGNYQSGTAVNTLIDHWDGTAWSQVASPNPAGSDLNSLDAAAATSASNVWAVGTYNNEAKATLTLIEHWNGTTWTQVPSPNLAGSSLQSVTATSASNAWAVGQYSNGSTQQALIEHWNGTTWTQVPSPSPGGATGTNALFSVASISSSDALAVGYYSDNDGATFLTLVEHWNGTAWEQVASQSPTDSSFLFAVAATSSFDAGAVGSYDGSSASTSGPLAEHV